MRILWVPHTPTESPAWEGSRPDHLFRRLGQEHELHWVNWRQSSHARDVSRWGKWSSAAQTDGTAHTVQLAPNFYRLITKVYPKPYHLGLNQIFFRSATRQIGRHIRPDVCVFSSSHHWTGFPFFDLGAPVVFDYVDQSPVWVEAAYVRASTAAVTVSSELASRLEPYRKPTFLVPNGVDLQRYSAIDRQAAKEKLGLAGHTVVSLIGLTCCPTLYFLNAIASLQTQIPALMLLIVGGGKIREAIVQRARELGIRHLHAPGKVANKEVHWYFAATDVGLYPGADTPYYWGASPLKVIEYSAAGAQVVSSPVDMFQTDWPNVRVVDATAAAFEGGIRRALDEARQPRDLRPFDWAALAMAFTGILQDAAGQTRQPERGPARGRAIARR